MELKLSAERRSEIGKGAAHKARAAGKVPGVVYGQGVDPVSISIDARELSHLLHTEAGMNVLVDLKVGSERILAMPREVQRDNLLGRYLHIDFLRIAKDQTVSVEVPVQVVGDSRGVREGGVVEHHLWTVSVECLPHAVPSHIEADISEVAMGDSIYVRDLRVPDAVTIVTALDEVVLAVVHPQAMRTAAEEAAEAAVEEGEGVEAAAAGAEGAEAAAEGGTQDEG